jgi:uncharacterized membrane protein
MPGTVVAAVSDPGRRLRHRGAVYWWPPVGKTDVMTDSFGGAEPRGADTIVGISFDDSFRAQEFLTASYRLAARGDVELRDAVMIVKDANGKTVVRETTDPQPGRSALSGGMWAGLFGLILGGPVGWLAGTAIGAGAGAVSAKIVDIGVPDEWVDWFREAVQPNTVTVALLLGRYDGHAAIQELERFAGARLVYANVPPDMVQRIRSALGDSATGPLTQDPDAHELPPPAAPEAASPESPDSAG